ncbi:MAG: hypothetical protein RR510_00335 [Morganella sp. (in: enterobacteria)]
MKNEKSSRQASAIIPKLIPTAGFNRNLNLPSENNEQTKQFLIAGAQDFILPGYPAENGYRVVKSIKKHHYRLITDGVIPETVYVVELRFRNDIVAGKTTCTQIKVWRTTADKHRFTGLQWLTCQGVFSVGCWKPIILLLQMKNKPETVVVFGKS